MVATLHVLARLARDHRLCGEKVQLLGTAYRAHRVVNDTVCCNAPKGPTLTVESARGEALVVLLSQTHTQLGSQTPSRLQSSDHGAPYNEPPRCRKPS